MGNKLVTYSEKWEVVNGYHLVIDAAGDYDFIYIFDDYETCMNVKNKIVTSISSGSKMVTYSHNGQHACVCDKILIRSHKISFLGWRKLTYAKILIPNTKFEEDSIVTSDIHSVTVEEKKYDKLFKYMNIDMTEEQMDKKVLQWHETNFPAGKEPKLHEYLGMTEREYSDYVEGFYIKVFKKSSE